MTNQFKDVLPKPLLTPIYDTETEMNRVLAAMLQQIDQSNGLPDTSILAAQGETFVLMKTTATNNAISIVTVPCQEIYLSTNQGLLKRLAKKGLTLYRKLKRFVTQQKTTET